MTARLDAPLVPRLGPRRPIRLGQAGVRIALRQMVARPGAGHVKTLPCAARLIASRLARPSLDGVLRGTTRRLCASPTFGQTLGQEEASGDTGQTPPSILQVGKRRRAALASKAIGLVSAVVTTVLLRVAIGIAISASPTIAGGAVGSIGKAAALPPFGQGATGPRTSRTPLSRRQRPARPMGLRSPILVAVRLKAASLSQETKVGRQSQIPGLVGRQTLMRVCSIEA